MLVNVGKYSIHGAYGIHYQEIEFEPQQVVTFSPQQQVVIIAS